MKSSALALALFSILLLQSCIIDLEFPQNVYSEVDHDLWQHFENFEIEAKKRGVLISLEDQNISAVIDEIHDRGVAGTCQFGSSINNHITIDQGYWNNSNFLYREFVVFHELGHCSLFRGHDESTNNSGLCLSIMRSGTGNCRDAYSQENRKAYLDELFLGID